MPAPDSAIPADNRRPRDDEIDEYALTHVGKVRKTEVRAAYLGIGMPKHVEIVDALETPAHNAHDKRASRSLRREMS
jgi:hypothetical protein